jgi:hypothetical protein
LHSAHLLSAWYSVSELLNNTVCCFLDVQLVVIPPNMWILPDMLLLSFSCLTWSESQSEMVCSTLGFFGNSGCVSMSARYPTHHSNAFQCSAPGLDRCPARSITALHISGAILVVYYMILPTIDLYASSSTIGTVLLTKVFPGILGVT